MKTLKSFRGKSGKDLSELSRIGATAKFEKYKHLNDSTRPPDEGELLYTCNFTNHIAGTSHVVQIRQGDRANNVMPLLFGNQMFKTKRFFSMSNLLGKFRIRFKPMWISGD